MVALFLCIEHENIQQRRSCKLTSSLFTTSYRALPGTGNESLSNLSFLNFYLNREKQRRSQRNLELERTRRDTKRIPSILHSQRFRQNRPRSAEE